MQARDPALPRGGGPGEGQKKPPADGGGFVSGFWSPYPSDGRNTFFVPSADALFGLPIASWSRLEGLAVTAVSDPGFHGRFCFERGGSLRRRLFCYQRHHAAVATH